MAGRDQTGGRWWASPRSFRRRRVRLARCRSWTRRETLPTPTARACRPGRGLDQQLSARPRDVRCPPRPARARSRRLRVGPLDPAPRRPVSQRPQPGTAFPTAADRTRIPIAVGGARFSSTGFIRHAVARWIKAYSSDGRQAQTPGRGSRWVPRGPCVTRIRSRRALEPPTWRTCNRSPHSGWPLVIRTSIPTGGRERAT